MTSEEFNTLKVVIESLHQKIDNMQSYTNKLQHTLAQRDKELQ
jgi:hypothetical protein